jgi:type VI secretion system VasD/TssJ family lipoprotein
MAAGKAGVRVSTRRRPGFAGAALLALGLAACHADVRPCETPPPFHLTIKASTTLNPNEKGQSLATKLRVLELKDLSRLQGAEYTEVFHYPENVFKEDLVSRVDSEKLEGLEVRPGGKSFVWVPRHKDARYVVVMGIFHTEKPDAWQVSFPLKKVQPGKCSAEMPGKRPPRPGEVSFEVYLEGTRIEAVPARP